MSNFSELRWTVLETFAKVTRACEELQETVLNSPITKQVLPFVLPATEGSSQPNTSGFENSQNPNNLHSQGLDEITRLYLSRWAAGIVERASNDLPNLLNGALSRLPNAAASEHGFMSSGLTSPFSEGIFDTEVGAFEVLSDNGRATVSYELVCLSREPLTPVEWIGFYTQNIKPLKSKLQSKLQNDKDEILKRIFSGGIDHDIRPEVWKYLLGVYPWEANECERKEILNKKSDTYWSIKQKWMDSTVRESEDFKEQSFRIEKDVLRTDRHIPLFSENEEDEHVESNLPQSNANLEQLKDILICYHFYNPSLGYVQGMSDLLSPIFAVMQDEVETFWCFVAFMDKVKTNFSRDQQGMHGQLTTLSLLIKLIAPTLHLHLVDISADNMFMCFRWLLIWFKREFSFDNIMRIWEIIWTNHLTKHYHLFIAAAILEMHQHVIAAHLHSLEEVLRYINDLSNVIDYRGILKRAELMFREFETRMAAFHKSENQERNSSGEMLPLLGGTNTPLIITPPPEIHSYTVSPSSPAFGPSTILLTTEEFKKLEFLLEK